MVYGIKHFYQTDMLEELVGHAYFGIYYLYGGALKEMDLGLSYSGERDSDLVYVQPIITLNSSVRLMGNSTNGWDIE